MTTEKQQRDFLLGAAADALPITFTDSSGTFSVFLSRLRFDSPHKREDRAEQRAELTLAEATGAPWSNTQAEFLRQCADDVPPLTYTDLAGRTYPVILARLNWQVPYKGPRGIEPVMQLRMVECVGPSGWISYAERAKIGVVATVTTGLGIVPNWTCFATACYAKAE